MKEGRKPEYPEKTPGDELQKIYTFIHDAYSSSTMLLFSFDST